MTGERVETAFHIAPDHPAFPGHFPGRPVVPAVVLLAEVLAAVEQTTSQPPESWTLANAKFLAPVSPGARGVIALQPSASGGRRFEVLVGDQVVATGELKK